MNFRFILSGPNSVTMYNLKNLCACLGILAFLKDSPSVSAQRMRIQPNTISVGVSTGTTTTPQTVVMECTPEGLSIDQIFTMYIKRDSVIFAELVTNRSPTLSTSAPNDIKTKNPTLDGNIDVNSPSASRLRVTFLASRMNCVDEDTYQCQVHYKPQVSSTTSSEVSDSLNVNVLPRDLMISAFKVQDFNLVPLLNLSVLDRGEQVEFSCTGYVGDSDTTVIEWYRKTLPNTFFQRFYPTQPGDSINDGFPSSYSCEYQRTSKLRFTVTSTDTTRNAFRCEVGAAQGSTPYRVHSQEFHITPSFGPTSGMTPRDAWKTSIVLVTVLIFGIIW